MATRQVSNRSQKFGRTAFLCAMAGLALALAITPGVFAGGFQLSVSTPSSAGLKLKDAVLVVKTFGCMQPADASVTANAEGLVDGKRQSIPLQLEQAGTGTYAIKQQWPSQGAWVITINGDYKGMTNSLLVELGPNGKVHPDTKLVEGNRKGEHVRGAAQKWAAADIQTALESLAANKSAVSEDTSEGMPPTMRATTWIVAAFGAFLFVVGFVTITKRTRPASKQG